jgi:hypothetical protein
MVLTLESVNLISLMSGEQMLHGQHLNEAVISYF